MASVVLTFALLLSSFWSLNRCGGAENVRGPGEDHRRAIWNIIDRLNSDPDRVYDYNYATFYSAQNQDVNTIDLTVRADVSCRNEGDQRCTSRVLLCKSTVVYNAATSQYDIPTTVSCEPITRTGQSDEEPEGSSLPETEPSVLPLDGVVHLTHEISTDGSEPSGEQFVAVKANSPYCLGCAVEINTNVEGLDVMKDAALKHIESERSNKHVVLRVLRVQQQVVSGIKYTLLLEVAQTVCSKDVVDLDNCPLDHYSMPEVCEIVYLQKPWINKDKHIISNNCTQSQEYSLQSESKPELPNDMDNEIDINYDHQKPVDYPGNYRDDISDGPNFDRIAEEGRADDMLKGIMSPERLRDLESQIIVDEPEGVVPLEASTETVQVPSDPNLEVQKVVDSFSSGESVVDRRQKRSLLQAPQLVKVSPEEQIVVRNLANFAVAALDNIDSDNRKRVVLQVLGAKKIDVGGTIYHLVLRVGVSECKEENVEIESLYQKPAEVSQDCRDKLIENLTKLCRIQVELSEDKTNPKVLKSQCQNMKRDNRDLNRTVRVVRNVPGGVTPLPDDDPTIASLATQALAHFDSLSNSPNKNKIVRISSASKQVVAGLLYKFTVEVTPTGCQKTDSTAPELCDALPDQSRSCNVSIWDRPWLSNGRETKIKCNGDSEAQSFRSKRDLGGQNTIDIDDPTIVRLSTESIKKFDAESDDSYRLKVFQIEQATRQVVSGMLYNIRVIVGLTDCTKGDTKPLEQCNRLPNGPSVKICNLRVWERAWLPDGTETTVKCEGSEKKVYRSSSSSSSLTLGGDDHDFTYELFRNYMNLHNKVYATEEERLRRFRVFKANMRKIKLLNEREQGTARYGATVFADLTKEEFQQRLGLRPDLRNENNVPFHEARIPDEALPTEFDWRKKGVVTKVKNQESCGSCWAFSVTGNIESQYAIKTGNLVELSEQELVDCDKLDDGCNGGLPDNAYRAIEQLGGLETEDNYPYEAQDEKCAFNRSLSRVSISGAVNISSNETKMAQWLVKNGPMSIGINANAMQFYMGGISHPWKFLCTPSNLDHGVLIVGYGVKHYPLFNKTLPYWIIKNSWGSSWGEQGYYRAYRGDGTCGLNQMVSSALI